jgi:hypothetical protein
MADKRAVINRTTTPKALGYSFYPSRPKQRVIIHFLLLSFCPIIGNILYARAKIAEGKVWDEKYGTLRQSIRSYQRRKSH